MGIAWVLRFRSYKLQFEYHNGRRESPIDNHLSSMLGARRIRVNNFASAPDFSAARALDFGFSERQVLAGAEGAEVEQDR
jgi:hypothetical protein